MKKGKLNIVFGGQAGSEAKGKLSGWLADHHSLDMIVITASPNAGHTVVTPEGKKMVSYNLPIAAVMCDCPIVMTAASLINYDILKAELEDLQIDPARLIIDPRASLIQRRHIDIEKETGKSDIGSTLQGIGACRTSKMGRRGSHYHTLVGDMRDAFSGLGAVVLDKPAASLINEALDRGKMVLCESTQGFDLDLEHGIDPVYCTSKMINPSMIAAEAGVAPSMVGDIVAVIRPYPIRVNNRTGTSGPYAEAEEIDWATIEMLCGHPAAFLPSDHPDHLNEITTTTKLPRRVFKFSWDRFIHMINVCRPTSICLQFANYVDWSCFGATSSTKLSDSIIRFIQRLEACSGVKVEWVGTGPGHEEMIWRDTPDEESGRYERM